MSSNSFVLESRVFSERYPWRVKDSSSFLHTVDMYFSDPYARTELLGSRDPAKPSSIFKQERPNSPTFLKEDCCLLDMFKEPAEMEIAFYIPDPLSHSSKCKGTLINRTFNFVFTSILSANIYLQGKGNSGMTIPRVRKRNALKSSVTKALAPDSETEEPGSVQGGAPRGKMQHQTQRSRSRGIFNDIFSQYTIPDVTTTAPPSENINMSLDMSTGSSKESHITLTIPPAFNKYHVTIIHGNTTSNYTVNGEAAASTPQPAMEEIRYNVVQELLVNPTESESH
ncbi:hypothetical protein ACHAQE_002674 [Botrytis cinerea]